MTSRVAKRRGAAGAEADLDAFERLPLPERARPNVLAAFALTDWRLAH